MLLVCESPPRDFNVHPDLRASGLGAHWNNIVSELQQLAVGREPPMCHTLSLQQAWGEAPSTSSTPFPVTDSTYNISFIPQLHMLI